MPRGAGKSHALGALAHSRAKQSSKSQKQLEIILLSSHSSSGPLLWAGAKFTRASGVRSDSNSG